MPVALSKVPLKSEFREFAPLCLLVAPRACKPALMQSVDDALEWQRPHLQPLRRPLAFVPARHDVSMVETTADGRADEAASLDAAAAYATIVGAHGDGEASEPVASTSTARCEVCGKAITDPDSHARSLAHLLAVSRPQPLKVPTYFAIGPTNRGRRMLEASGWSEDSGRGLGAQGQGAVAPIRASDKHDRLGIGLQQRRRTAAEIAATAAGKDAPQKLPGSGRVRREREQRIETQRWTNLYRHLDGIGDGTV